MAALQFHPTHDSMLDFLVEKATPQEILAFKVSQAEQERTLELLDKQNEGTLTPEEEAELEAIRQMDLLYMALRAKALRALHQSI
jgi:trans-aconitate methyltransferase